MSALAAPRLVQPDVGGLDRQPAAVGHRVAGVDAQVQQRVFKLVGIDQRGPQPGRGDHLDVMRRTDGAADQLLHVGDQRG